jgi:hypothetical protein
MARPILRYATTLATSINDSVGTIEVSNLNFLQGLAPSGGAAAAPLTIAGRGFLRIIQPLTSVATSCIPSAVQYKVEVVRILAAPSLISGTRYSILVERNINPTDDDLTIATENDYNDRDTVLGAAPDDFAMGSGTYSQGVVDYAFTTRTGATGFDFTAGAVVENLRHTARLREAEGLTAADDEDYAADMYGGAVRFLKTGNTSLGGYQVNTGMTINSWFGYQTASSKRINLGRFIPILEFTVELEHRFPDGRYFKFRGHRCAVTPDNPSFDFSPTDWIGAELQIDVLQSFDIANEANPYGYIEIDNDPISLQPVSTIPETYSAGVYNLYLTPNVASRALTQGLPTTRFSIGNVRTGNLSAPQEFLEHYVGIPQIQDAKIRLKYQMNLTTTIESLTAENMALLFNGSIEDIDKGVAPAYSLLTVSAAPTTPVGYGLRDVNHSVGYIMLDAT